MNKREEILEQAEIRVREGGYNNFSFRELAKDVGIKSASVHYYFPTKEDLGAALAAKYTETFLDALGAPQNVDNSHPIARYIEAFRHALTVDKKMCLCGLFGAEAAGLPGKVRFETSVFFERNIDWLSAAYAAADGLEESAAQHAALRLVSLLEGAMLVSNAMLDNRVFETCVADLLAK